MRGLVLLLALLLAAPAAAQDAELEREARALGQTLRCVVCQNESIEDSNADLAADMRRVVRERLAAGDSPEDVRAFMRARYGDYVLLKPPVQRNTLVLWFAPLGLVLGMGAWVVLRRRGGADVPGAPAALSEAERNQLERLRREARK